MACLRPASPTRGGFVNHILSISLREKDGRAEFDQTKADVIIVQSARGTWVIDRPATQRSIQGGCIKGQHPDRSQSKRYHPHPAGITHQFSSVCQADHIHARKSRRSALSIVKTRPPTWLGNTCQTCVSPVSLLSHGSNSINCTTVGTLNGSLSPNLLGEAQNLGAGTCDLSG
jgi:hypothetical protein